MGSRVSRSSNKAKTENKVVHEPAYPIGTFEDMIKTQRSENMYPTVVSVDEIETARQADNDELVSGKNDLIIFES